MPGRTLAICMLNRCPSETKSAVSSDKRREICTRISREAKRMPWNTETQLGGR